MKKHSVIINKKEYTLPTNLDIDAYLNYLEIRDDVMQTKYGMYSADQFRNMISAICQLYDNQFTVEELTNKETGLSVSSIILEFVAIEQAIGEQVDEKVEKLKENFTNGN